MQISSHVRNSSSITVSAMLSLVTAIGSSAMYGRSASPLLIDWTSQSPSTDSTVLAVQERAIAIAAAASASALIGL